MSDCLYGKLNSETIKKEYQGDIEKIDPLKIDTANVLVDNVNNIIRAQVNKTPGTLKITKSVNAGEKKTLVEFDGSKSKEINLDEVDAYTGVDNETSKTTVDTEHNEINVEVKRTPGKIKFEKGGKILTDHLNKEVEFDGSEDTTLHIPETSFETTETFETVYDETSNRVKGNVLKTPNRLIINNPNDGNANIFDGSSEVNINLPEKGVKHLIGTEEKPINLYTDLDLGEIYLIEGKVLYSSGIYPNISLTQAYKISKTLILIFGTYSDDEPKFKFSSGVIGSYYVVSSTGYITYCRKIVGPTAINDNVDVTRSIYAPTEIGTFGQVLMSRGVGAPMWTNAVIQQISGTQSKPINLATDLKVGTLYSVSGYIALKEGSTLNASQCILIFKVASTFLMLYDVFGTILDNNNLFFNIKRGASTYILINANTGYVTGCQGTVSPAMINNGPNSVNIFAPTTGGTRGQILQSNGNSAPIWTDLPETGISELIGTEDKPINWYTDLQVGNYYIVTGTILHNSSSVTTLSKKFLAYKNDTYGVILYNIKLTASPSINYNTEYVNTRLTINNYGYPTGYRHNTYVSNVNGDTNIYTNIYVPTSAGTSGQILKSNGTSNAPTWFTPDYASQSYVDTQISNMGIGISVSHYDDTTLSDHLDEILSYTNPSNGGTLLFIGFRLNTGVNGDRIKTSMSNNSGMSVITESDVNLISNETFITFRPTAVEPNNGVTQSVKFVSSDTGNNGIINLVLDKSGDVLKAILSGSSSVAFTSNREVNQYFFDNIDIINQPITHLVIEYQKSN